MGSRGSRAKSCKLSGSCNLISQTPTDASIYQVMPRMVNLQVALSSALLTGPLPVASHAIAMAAQMMDVPLVWPTWPLQLVQKPWQLLCLHKLRQKIRVWIMAKMKRTHPIWDLKKTVVHQAPKRFLVLRKVVFQLRTAVAMNSANGWQKADISTTNTVFS